MKDVFKMILGFTAILIIGLAGVTISEMMKLGEMSPAITTIDNLAHTR